MTITYANDKTIVHKGDGLQFVAMAPDVCKTPTPGGPVPIPYPNIAFSRDLADGSQSVKVEGNPAALANSYLSISTGDEAGTAGGGVASNKIKGKMTWILFSTDVKFEGQGVARFKDDNLHNGNMANTKGKDVGTSDSGEIPKVPCVNCGGDVNDAYHNKLRDSLIDPDDNTAASIRSRGHVKAAVTNTCYPKMTTGVAGQVLPGHILSPNNFAGLARNFLHNTAIPAKQLITDPFAPGNCAEQKALVAANQQGLFPPKSPCKAKMSIRDSEGKHVAPCKTCERILASMMCQKPQKKS